MIDAKLKFGKLYDFNSQPIYLVLHHAAADGSIDAVHNYHLSLGWSGCAYHAYVRKDGKVYQGRPLDKQGGHTEGHNYHSIGICFEGNFETDTMTPAQITGGVKAIKEVLAKYPSLKILGHKELTPTACPGKNFPLEYFKQYEENGMEYVGNGRLQIYVNSARKTMNKIKSDTGCTAIINGGLFDMAKFSPIAQLKADGKIYANENWGINYGIGWNDRPTMTCEIGAFQNFIGCICMVRNGEAVSMSYPADLGGARARTALGIMSNGFVWMYATPVATTPEQLQKIALRRGVRDAIMLDGGGSTQGMYGAEKVNSTRIVQNFILVYDNDNIPQKPTCPYTEPTKNVTYGSRGDGVLWVQWMLNQYGYGLDVDGISGAKTYSAIKSFQKSKKLTADGICGAKTRSALKEGV